MGLSSLINFRTSSVDSAGLFATATSSIDGSDASGAFERHLDDVGRADTSPADRAAARDDGRQRGDATREAKKVDSGSSPSDDTGEETSSLETSPIAIVAQTQPRPAESETPDAAGDDIIVAETPDGETDETRPALAEAPLAATGDDEVPLPLDAEAPLADEAPTSTASGQPVETATTDGVDATVAAAISTAGDTRAAPQPTGDRAATLAAAAELAAPAAVSSVEIAPTEAPGDNAFMDAEAEADAESGLAAKSREGLGHEAAARMAEKSGAAPQTPSAVQASVAPATATASPTKSSAAGGVPAIAIAAADAGESAFAGRLGDLQSAGVGPAGNSNAPTIRIGTLAGQTQPTQVPAMAIALQIARNLQNGSNRFDIRLDPPELGRIDVRMEVRKDGTVSAHLTVEKTQTLDLLQRDARALQQALNDAGLQADSDSLNFSLRDQNAGGDARDFSGSHGTRAATAATGAEDVVANAAYNVNLSATGGVDIRV